jgi:organic radical activating enzyme
MWHTITVVCSPKARITSRLIPHIDALKYVLQADAVDPDDGLPTHALDSRARPGRIDNFAGDIYLQPCDEQDGELTFRNTQAVIASCMKYGYRLCLQTHKLLGLP